MELYGYGGVMAAIRVNRAIRQSGGDGDIAIGLCLALLDEE